MCSKDPDEIGVVKSELGKAGIRSEVRQNPLTAALQLTRLELWLEDESDFSKASRLYSMIRDRTGNGHATAGSVPTETYIEVEAVPAQSASADKPAVRNRELEGTQQSTNGELEEASLMLEKEIEEILERDAALAHTCATLRSQVEELNGSLLDSRNAAEKGAAEFAALKRSLENELAERKRSTEELEAQLSGLGSQLKSSEGSLAEKIKAHESTLEQLRTQQSMVVELRKEIVSLESELRDHRKQSHQVRAELEAEKGSRRAAEQKAEQAARVNESLQTRLAEQKGLQEQLRASVGSLNSLRGRLQAKKASIRS